MTTQAVDIKLIVGLGNPGPQYQQTRHNAGVWFVERLCADYSVNLVNEAKHFGQTARIQLNNLDTRLLVPNTFMNLSGKAVISMVQFYKLSIDNVLVVHDELDLPPGTAKIKFGGGHGGHNGLRDIIQKFGGKKDFYRLRIGIGHPGDKSQVHNFVLGKANNSDQRKMDLAVDESLLMVPTLLRGDLASAMNQLHSFRAEPT